MIAFKVVTPKGEYLKQEVKSIHVKTVVGETTILPNHMPIFASLVPCKLVLKNENDEEEIFAISGGFLQFNKNEGTCKEAQKGLEQIWFCPCLLLSLT